MAAAARLTSGTGMRQTARQAARYGTVTSEDKDESEPGPAPRRVLEEDDTGKLVVARGSWTRYTECAKLSGVYPDPNLLHLLPFSNLPQQCRPDEMHQFRGGLMQHLMSAMMSRYTMVLHPHWAMHTQTDIVLVPGVQGMRQVWERLGQRIRNSGVGLSDFVQRSFTRAFEGRETHSDHVFKMRLTGAEVEVLFRLLPLCLPNLVLPEVATLNNAAPAGTVQCDDPSDTLIVLLGDFLNWYIAITGHNLDDLTLDTLFEEAGALLQRMHDELPARHMKVPGRGAAQSTQCNKSLESDVSEPGAGEEHWDWIDFMGSVLDASGDDDSDDSDWAPAAHHSDSEGSGSENSCSNGQGTDKGAASTGADKSKWGIPKARNMYHCPESVRLFGPLHNTSTETLERRHAEVGNASSVSHAAFTNSIPETMFLHCNIHAILFNNWVNMLYLLNMVYWLNMLY